MQGSFSPSSPPPLPKPVQEDDPGPWRGWELPAPSCHTHSGPGTHTPQLGAQMHKHVQAHRPWPGTPPPAQKLGGGEGTHPLLVGPTREPQGRGPSADPEQVAEQLCPTGPCQLAHPLGQAGSPGAACWDPGPSFWGAGDRQGQTLGWALLPRVTLMLHVGRGDTQQMAPTPFLKGSTTSHSRGGSAGSSAF